MSRKNQIGRSMIEMLGVLGIMAVITVLAITAYRMAYRNSKMNDLKQDVASISQQLGKVYSNQRYTDEGVVLGEDKTFENLFVDTKMFKSAITPFGGTYELSAVSNDMFELKVTGAETEDCKYIISDDAITKKFPEISMACEDIDGTEHYTNNNPNGVPNLSPDEIAQENGFTNAREINSRCYNNNDEAACSLLQENPDLIDEQHGGYLCNFKNKDWACSELCDRDNFISCNKGCALNDDDSCNRISEFDIDSLTKEELTILNSICYNNQKDAACSILQEQPDLIDDRYGNYLCNYQAKDWACSELCDRDNFISCNKSCGFANDESCNKMSEFDTSTLTDSEVTALNSTCYNNQKDVACSMLQEEPELIDDKYGGYLCNFQSKEWACSELCSRDSFSSCSKSCGLQNDDSCNKMGDFDTSTLSASDITALNSTCYNNRKDVACSMLQNEPDLMEDKYGGYLCTYQSKDWACQEMCSRGDTSSCNKVCGSDSCR